jgi:hypothetical protein
MNTNILLSASLAVGLFCAANCVKIVKKNDTSTLTVPDIHNEWLGDDGAYIDTIKSFTNK